MLCLRDKTSKSRVLSLHSAQLVYIHLHAAAKKQPRGDESLRHVSPCMTTVTSVEAAFSRGNAASREPLMQPHVRGKIQADPELQDC